MAPRRRRPKAVLSPPMDQLTQNFWVAPKLTLQLGVVACGVCAPCVARPTPRPTAHPAMRVCVHACDRPGQQAVPRPVPHPPITCTS